MSNELVVSICCITYNHEDYIAEAIESFLMQKTNFKYEILIHDDASIDKTAEIIREYEIKYPSLIKPIYQTENQYSKGVMVGEFNTKRAKGKYLAICEGDDFWVDPFKLQKQVDYMEQAPECSMCVHAFYFVASGKRRINKQFCPKVGNRFYSVEEVIEGGGGLFATNSIMCLKEYTAELPTFYKNAPVGDYPLAIYMALQGSVYYFDEFMSAYRVNVKNSWTSKNSSSINKIVKHYNEIEKMLEEINQYTDYKYKDAIQRTKIKNKFNVLVAQGKCKEIKIGEYKALYNDLGLGAKMKIFLKQYCPRLVMLLKKIKGSFQYG